MSEEPILRTRSLRETPEEAQLREWFAKQQLDNLTTLETAARQVIQLVTALFGTTFGVLSLSSASFNNMLADPTIKILGGLTLFAWAVALVCALGVTTPFPYSVSEGLPDSYAAAVNQMQQRKKWAFYSSIVAFGVGIIIFALFIGTLIAMR